jgi:hypothetical protein
MLRGVLRAGAITGLGLMLLTVPVLAADSDGDGLADAFERRWGVTDYLDPDSDRDGVVDSAEDLDGDRLGNLGEQRSRTNPSVRDTDGDGIPDGKEDADRDGVSNAREQDKRIVPRGLRPTLGGADDDRQPDRIRCQAKHRVSAVKSCVFGDPSASTTVVLVGDSIMTMYLTAYKRIAEDRGWRLMTMTKAACPAFVGLHGTLQYRIDKGRSCRAWRRKVIDRLNTNPPEFIIFGHAPYKLKTIGGSDVPVSSRPAVWQRAVKQTLRRLPAESEVLVLGLLPRTRTDPVGCLRNHRRDLSRCVTRAVPAAKRRLDQAIARGARRGGGRYATLHDKVCTYDPCPLVQGNVLMWRDSVHLTETFARKLKPSIATMLDRHLFGSGS